MSMNIDQPKRLQDELIGKDRLRLWLKLLSVTRSMESQLRERLKQQHGTTLPQFDVMAALDRFPEGLRMSDLSGVMRVSNGNITGIVDRLTANGIVERTPIAGDRRAWLVRLTQKGQKEFTQQASDHEQWVSEMLSSISNKEIAAFSDLLEAIGSPNKTSS